MKNFVYVLRKRNTDCYYVQPMVKLPTGAYTGMGRWIYIKGEELDSKLTKIVLDSIKIKSITSYPPSCNPEEEDNFNFVKEYDLLQVNLLNNGNMEVIPMKRVYLDHVEQKENCLVLKQGDIEKNLVPSVRHLFSQLAQVPLPDEFLLEQKKT